MLKTKEVIAIGEGKNYPFGQDHCFIKLASTHTNGELCFVEDTLKPGFHLPRHHHKKMLEVFYILEGEIEYIFDDETIIAKPGDTITVPPYVWHEARCEKGGKMLSIFKNGRFDEYLQKLSELTDSNFADKNFMTKLCEEYDIYE